MPFTYTWTVSSAPNSLLFSCFFPLMHSVKTQDENMKTSGHSLPQESLVIPLHWERGNHLSWKPTSMLHEFWKTGYDHPACGFQDLGQRPAERALRNNHCFNSISHSFFLRSYNTPCCTLGHFIVNTIYFHSQVYNSLSTFSKIRLRLLKTAPYYILLFLPFLKPAPSQGVLFLYRDPVIQFWK